ncbi:hypothetical protein CANARDRAFT_29312 [[Candida] arabinofermentans NRRL YB-2248]|uniref:Alb1-domain-containing protein n=1 Tax=[Candida] arabinofermentans NRRL YB-2248 TaxID=983967 RepID=A0A1E4SXC8_9ASCO|nr:hypothetical protein CANARDRAFT_29312 [[Candida] arabinofermentans NRRL YB-2248]
MAKKISKHSRASRRGENEITGEERSLDNIPRAQNTDVIGSLIRNSTAKNEELLRTKMERKALQKAKSDLLAKASSSAIGKTGSKKSSMISKAVRTKKRKFTNIDGRLSSKIEASINRAKEVQSTRKTGWDIINKSAKEAVLKQGLIGNKKGRKRDADEQDAMDEDGWEDISDDDHHVDEPEFETKPNAFSVLEEVEA